MRDPFPIARFNKANDLLQRFFSGSDYRCLGLACLEALNKERAIARGAGKLFCPILIAPASQDCKDRRGYDPYPGGSVCGYCHPAE